MLQRASTDQKMHQRDTVFQWSPERHAAKIYRIERDFFWDLLSTPIKLAVWQQ